jgi:DNA mismatch endonuclease (patch repair protein)
MLGNRGRDTKPELALRGALWQSGLRGYRTNLRVAGVRPDVVFTRKRVAVFVHGCFWHSCPECGNALPRSNRSFWAAKFRRNRERDREKRRILEGEGWQVVELWAHQVSDEASAGRAAAAIGRRLGRRLLP